MLFYDLIINLLYLTLNFLLVKLKIIFIFFIFLNLSYLYSQREAGIWYFGEKAGLDFNSGSPVALTNGQMVTGEGCASISDKDGNLLFYTDGKTVWNSKHQIMQEGTGLLGHSSSTQSAIIVPNPINPKIYYIFTVDEPSRSNADDDPKTYTDDGVNDGLNYTEVNMSLANGLGAVNPSKKNIHLITYNKNNAAQLAYKCSEKITAVQHADGNSFWVITHFIDRFYAFHVDGLGVSTTPKVSTTSTIVPTGGYLLNAIGYLKSSPNGKKIGIVHMGTRNTNEPNPKGGIVRNSGKVLLYDFNSATGFISNQTNVITGVNPYGLAFSSKSKRLYVSANNYNSSGISEGSSLYQFDLESNSVASSKKLIKTNNWVSGGLQLAIDEKIYRAGYPVAGESEYLSVINSPETLGTSCDFREREIYLEGRKVVKGLPPFIQSLFLFNFKYEYTCLGDATHFYISTFEPIDSVIWDFGDGTTSTDLDAYHTYNQIGTYTVTLTKIVNGETKEPIIKDVIIKNKPLVLTTTHQLIQCDSYDNNPNDELGTFNLTSAIDAITLNNSENFNVFFYLNDIDADNDLYHENSLPETYRNIKPNQIITVKVIYKDSNCYSLGKIELIANPSLLLSANDLIGCDLGNGTAEFNFTSKELEIITSLNLPPSVKIYFFGSEEDVINNTNLLSGIAISEEKRIYFRAVNNDVCYGAGNFDLLINYFPKITLKEELFICADNFPIEISSTIPLNLQSNYTFTWSNGKTTPNISIYNQQEISLTITDKIYNCHKVKHFIVNQVTAPIITKVQVNSDSYTASVITKHNFENEFAIDNIQGIYKHESLFTNLSPGIHTIYVKNKFSCNISSKQIYVLGFPKFFTPNNDGFNDTWNILGVDSTFYQSINIYIFDRFGKFITQIDPRGNGWNGLYNGQTLPSSDYWFSVELIGEDGTSNIRKGHFSLVRK